MPRIGRRAPQESALAWPAFGLQGTGKALLCSDESTIPFEDQLHSNKKNMDYAGP